MTNFIKKDEIKNNWLLIDAENAVVGRLAAFISKVLRGKDNAQYTPHMDNGDFVVVTNIEKIKFTGKKINNKIYYKHTGHPGGIKSTTPALLMKKKTRRSFKACSKKNAARRTLSKKTTLEIKNLQRHFTSA